jgi:hypothetical protein
MPEHGDKMKLEELRDKLEIKNRQVRLAASLHETFRDQILGRFYEGAGIDIADAEAKGSYSDKVVIEGKTSFPLLKLPDTTKVQATFKLDSEGTLGVTLRYEPAGFRFLESFPDLPLISDDDSQQFDDDSQQFDYESRQSFLDTLKLTDCRFYLTSHTHKLKDDPLFEDVSGDVFLDEGLNFVGRWVPGGMLALFEQLRGAAGGTPTVLHGPVILHSAALRPLEDDQFPWDARPRIPGIHLQADLGFEVSLPPDSDAGMKLKKLRFHVYSPLSWPSPPDEPSYGLATAYAGDLLIPSISTKVLATMTAAKRRSADEELVVAGEFKVLTLDNLATALTDLAGRADSFEVLPEDVRDVIGSLGLRSASITLLSSFGGYEVGCSQFTIGMTQDERKPWSLFGGFIQIGFESLRIAVLRPFDSDERLLVATIRGKAIFLRGEGGSATDGVELDVKVEYPGYYLSAVQVGRTTFDLQGYLNKACGQEGVDKSRVPCPDFLRQVELSNMWLEADPGSRYAFSMSLSTPYKVDDKYSLPALRLAVSYHAAEKSWLVWQFEASTKKDEEAVPVFLLIKKLAKSVGVAIELPDAVKDLLSVRSVAVGYNSKDENFAFECWSRLRLFSTITADCGFTIEHTPAKLDPPKAESKTRFGGQIVVRPEEGKPPLSFGLEFGTEGDSKYCLAAYSDEYGYSLKIKSLAECIFPKSLADLVPPSLEVSLKSALLAYSREPKVPPKNGEEAEVRVVFGVDLGAKIDISDLPVIGSALPKDLAIGFESLRVIVASTAFNEDSVAKLNGLRPEGIKPLPDTLQSGFNVSVALLFGKEPRTLTLRGAEEPPTPASPAAGGGSEAAGSQETPASTSPAGQSSPDGATKWFEIDKSLGPLSVQRIGLTYEAPRQADLAQKVEEKKAKVGVKFDASLQLGALTFNLEGLGLLYALGDSTDALTILRNLEFTLDGMGLALGNGPIEIGGSLVWVPPLAEYKLELEGALLIRTAPFTFTAFGSYVQFKDGTISVNAFAVLLMELGDPTGTGGLVITGLAFGFGVNRKLTLPPIEKVHEFPLVQAAMGKQDFKSIQELPKKLRPFVLPAPGNFWVAAGIKFNSFVIVDSFLLLSVSWGAEVEIGLLGLSRMTMPPREPDPDKMIAGGELALRGVIRIADGLIQFEAQLTENSFIFSKACRLTGGFAFSIWFAGPHAGDFVISLGGYHPAFARPAHYPLVPRLGMQLKIGTELSITGEAYFAITPSCIMAGGKLCAVFKSGGIEAWFIAYADFLMSWQPFFYRAEIGITLGVALPALALRVELSVDLKLWGPAFGGEARVQLWVISFTIPFGKAASEPLALEPPAFVRNCLPAPRVPAQETSPDVFSVRITKGLVREQKDHEDTHRIVNAHQLSLTAQSVIPSTQFEGLAKGVKGAAPCGIRPMGIREVHSIFKAELFRPDGRETKQVQVSAITGNVPDALWGKCDEEGYVPLPKKPETKTIEATIGIRITCASPYPIGDPIDPPDGPAYPLPDIAIEKLSYQDIYKGAGWENPEEITNPYAGAATFSEIMSKKVVDERAPILDCLQHVYDSHYEARKNSKKPIEERTLNEPHLEELEELAKLENLTKEELKKLAKEKESYSQSAPDQYALGSSL